eukprot:CAMPEP_0119117044 /NCGR_PEP_ID=MMETSP1180-20130426/52622_1 /TAXON_ID=3052 ORGANISM="Chlamydomonas cf sp, Strain CCMP681" /NCGR_SAMPLE_ID=MMETSP1180 /ASSEMBLY_ACC=CAM_ASM_000741 /LENGTH=77 /DNA_ID=CAMNT_0007106259 /DNA_START=54 /DNA_END=287 /DNA_ORIENTATION=+
MSTTETGGKPTDPDFVAPGSTIPELAGRQPQPYELTEKAGSKDLEGDIAGEHVKEHIPAVETKKAGSTATKASEAAT